MNNWIVLMIIDVFVISFSEVFKKKALKKNSTSYFRRKFKF